MNDVKAEFHRLVEATMDEPLGSRFPPAWRGLRDGDEVTFQADFKDGLVKAGERVRLSFYPNPGRVDNPRDEWGSIGVLPLGERPARQVKQPGQPTYYSFGPHHAKWFPTPKRVS